jgi:hypothetical protein
LEDVYSANEVLDLADDAQAEQIEEAKRKSKVKR